VVARPAEQLAPVEPDGGEDVKREREQQQGDSGADEPPRAVGGRQGGNVLVLGLIVVIRTFLSFSLETEIEGTVPWRRAAASGVGTIRRATASALDRETPP
jgi:hypothetical protein